ncbi:hypothetical protein OC846_003641, partial [Tilletia horrida]
MDSRQHRGFVDEVGLWSAERLAANPPLAATADIMKIYEEAVQEPLIEVTNLDSLYSQVQLEDTDRYDARILREDFCSTAIVAKSWLSLDPQNKSQGVDIDLDALQDTQQRYGPEAVRIVQAPRFSGEKNGPIELEPISKADAVQPESTRSGIDSPEAKTGSSSTWDVGAASDRFERRFQARQAREKAKAAQAGNGKQTVDTGKEPRLTLLHSDVLDLPLPPIQNSKETLDPPDLIAALNYGLCYFHDRSTLVEYLAMCARTLRPKTGVLICDQWGGPPTGEAYPPDQPGLWAKFEQEVGFKRKRASENPLMKNLAARETSSAPDTAMLDELEAALLHDDVRRGLLAIYPEPTPDIKDTPAEWPRGKLKMVRKGKQHGGFEYWREDGPIDFMTNRFRMGLSFRFSDGSWIRDFFSYDFRIWSIKEITEAMTEAGFKRVSVHVLPRNVHDDEDSDSDVAMSSRSNSPSPAEGIAAADEDEDEDLGGLEDMSRLIRQTEKEERERAEYHCVQAGEKVFATRAFA